MKSDLRVGDTIQCTDADEMVEVFTNLAKMDIQAEFAYELNGNKGYYLVIEKIGRAR